MVAADTVRFPMPSALAPAKRMLDDAHAHFHAAVEAYHKPGTFHREVEALVQAVRNVTFRVQSAKTELPADFDAWYGAWREFMRSDPHLHWLNEARIDIVKRSGLRSQSRAQVAIVDSYLPPTRFILELPADTPTQAVLHQAQQLVDPEVRRHVAIRVARRWSVPAWPDDELLGVIAYCMHVIDALLVWIAELVAGGEPSPPADYIAYVDTPACLRLDPSLRYDTFFADSLERFELGWRRHATDPAVERKAVKRYGDRTIDMSTSPIDVGRQIHETARRLLRKDGSYLPTLFLRAPGGEWEFLAVPVEDKRQKFLLWHAIGAMVSRVGYDALVYSTEVWFAPLPTEVHPYPDLSTRPDRRELLVTWVAADQCMPARRIVSTMGRVLGRLYLKTPVEEDEPTEHGFLLPVQLAWKLRREDASEPSTDTRDTAT